MPAEQFDKIKRSINLEPNITPKPILISGQQPRQSKLSQKAELECTKLARLHPELLSGIGRAEWLKRYVDNPKFIELYQNKQNFELVAEATFWSVKLGLASLLAKMSYAEIRAFKPLAEGLCRTTERAILIKQVMDKLERPPYCYEASFALGQAAWAIYARQHTYDTLMEQKTIYEESQRDIESTRPPKRPKV